MRPTRPMRVEVQAVELPASGPAGRPWLCRVHDVAGSSIGIRCCPAATPLDGPADRAAWYALRLAAKPDAERASIRMSCTNMTWSARVLAEHAAASGRAWTWVSAVERDRTRTGRRRKASPRR